MKRIFTIGAVLSAVMMFGAFTVTETLGINGKMPAADIRMESIHGKDYSLNELKGENGLLVIFSCNTCPFVVGSGDSEGWDGRYNEIYKECDAKGIGMVLINSNEAKRGKGDSMENMKTYASKRNLKSQYVLDKDHVVADAFGARTTPHVFLFGKSDKLEYKGAIDDNVGSASAVSEHWLSDALMAMSAGKKIDPRETKNTGCSIKRVEKK